MKRTTSNIHYNPARRRFIKQTAIIGTAVGMLPPAGRAFGSLSLPGGNCLIPNPIGFNGQRRDLVTGCYHLGNGHRTYNPRLMRFHAADSMSPFGKGGLNSYAYCMCDPINLRDPSGHFALISLLTGMIVGAVVGAAISATAEGIRAAVTHTSFNWNQVAMGAVLGGITGGFGVAAHGASLGAKIGLAAGDTLVSGLATFGMEIAVGSSVSDAGMSALYGAVIGAELSLLSFTPGSKEKSVRLGGTMKDIVPMGQDFYFFDDVYKGSKRLNIVAHGILQSDGTAQLYRTSGQHMSANDLFPILSHRKNLHDYASIRTIMCHSGNGGGTSFGSKLAKLSGKPVKSYVDTVTGNFEVKKFNSILFEATTRYGDDGLEYMLNKFSQTHTFQVRKENPFSFFSRDFWGYSYNPIHFIP